MMGACMVENNAAIAFANAAESNERVTITLFLRCF
jgi:hypothetical protein